MLDQGLDRRSLEQAADGDVRIERGADAAISHIASSE
jgi:hypothetical protein